MGKQITLNLTDTEYKKLMILFYLGHFVEDSITEKTQKELLDEVDFMEKISKQAYESGSKNVFVEDGMYGITKEMEDRMLECFEGFKEFIYSGQDALEDKTVEENVMKMMEMEKNGKKKK